MVQVVHRDGEVVQVLTPYSGQRISVFVGLDRAGEAADLAGGA